MARPLRINYSNACYHVMNRGAGRKNIFKNDLHRNVFLQLLNESHTMFNINIHAYCLMDNHYHLLLSTPDANLPRAMRHINGVYTQRYNHLTKSDGSLFRGRYTAQLIEDDCYQLIVSRYIHLNPVKAKITCNATDYKWSSYRAYIGLIEAPTWLTMDHVLEQIATSKSLSHIKNYQDYVEDKEINEINVFTSTKHTGPIIGSESFRNKILSQINPSTAHACAPDIKRCRKIPDTKLIMKNVCAFYNIDHKSFMFTRRGHLNWPRLIFIYISRKCFGHTLRTISESLGYIPRITISTAIHKCIQRLNQFNTINEVNVIHELIIKESLQGDT